jgi:nucleolar pre-ribosomal-associated protein 2
MIKRVQKHEASLSIECLRAFCKMHALGPDGSEKTNWLILTTVAEINPDVFVAGEEGSDLLQDVLNRMAADDDHPAQKSRIVQSISTGFVDARGSSTFVKIWFQHLVATEPQENDVISWEGSCESHWWYSNDLCTTISQSLEKTMNYRQIVSLLDWLDSQADGAAENVSLILLLETLSQGITQDEIADSVCMRVFHIVSKRTLPSSTPAKTLRYKWRVLTRCLEWATLEEVYEIWTASVTDLQHALAERAPGFDFCFGPFKFAVAAWLANYPGGKYEDDAAEFTISALFALSQPRNVRGKQPIIDRSMIRSVFRPHLGGCPRLLRCAIYVFKALLDLTY